MGKPIAPSTMRALQYSSNKGGIVANLRLNETALPKVKAQQHLVQIFATALNPVDYKPADVPYVGRFLVPNPATPGIDIVGRIVTPAAGSSLKPGQLVFGVAGTSPFAAGGLAEYAAAPETGIVALPEGVNPIDAATVGVAGLTAYQSILPHVKKGDRVFLNGGSGGTGVFGIQIAKAAGCHVTTSCSTRNVELCKSLGADEVLDYATSDVLEGLKKLGNFDHVVDNVGSDKQLYWKSHEYTKPKALYMMVASAPTFEDISFTIKAAILPGFLGGGKRKLTGIFARIKADQLTEVGAWMNAGKVKAVVDQRFPLEQAPDAFRKLKTGRARGKIVVDIASPGTRA